jgi:hypothetical protein
MLDKTGQKLIVLDDDDYLNPKLALRSHNAGIDMEFMVNHVGGDESYDDDDSNVYVQYVEVDDDEDEDTERKTETKKRKTACRITFMDRSLAGGNVSVASLNEVQLANLN